MKGGIDEKEIQRRADSEDTAGWFEDLSGVVLGRNAGPDSATQPYESVLKDFFGEFTFPVIFDADIGHRQPNLTILNGALTTFRCDSADIGEMCLQKNRLSCLRYCNRMNIFTGAAFSWRILKAKAIPLHGGKYY